MDHRLSTRSGRDRSWSAFMANATSRGRVELIVTMPRSVLRSSCLIRYEVGSHSRNMGDAPPRLLALATDSLEGGGGMWSALQSASLQAPSSQSAMDRSVAPHPSIHVLDDFSPAEPTI